MYACIHARLWYVVRVHTRAGTPRRSASQSESEDTPTVCQNLSALCFDALPAKLNKAEPHDVGYGSLGKSNFEAFSPHLQPVEVLREQK